MYGCQQVLIHANRDIEAIIKYLCSESNKVYNCALYYARQMFFKKHVFVNNGKPQGFWSNALSALTEKRNRQVRDAINKAARLVINYCIENSIGRIVLGWNKGQKDGATLGKKGNQNFIQIPTARLKSRIQELCSRYGIELIETEESYTSKASFLDHDFLPEFGEKPDNWKPSGKRVKRGLYRTAFNQYINADCNAAANIIRKVSATLGLNLNGVSSGALTTPLRVRFWTT